MKAKTVSTTRSLSKGCPLALACRTRHANGVSLNASTHRRSECPDGSRSRSQAGTAGGALTAAEESSGERSHCSPGDAPRETGENGSPALGGTADPRVSGWETRDLQCLDATYDLGHVAVHTQGIVQGQHELVIRIDDDHCPSGEG